MKEPKKHLLIYSKHLKIISLFQFSLYVAIFLILTTKCTKQFQFNLGHSSQLISITSPSHQDKISSFPATNFINGVTAFQQQDYLAATQYFSQASKHREQLVHWYLIQAQSHTDQWVDALDSINLQNTTERLLFVKLVFEKRALISSSEMEERLYIIQQYSDMTILYAHYLLSDNQFSQAASLVKSLPDYDQLINARLIVGRSLFYSGQLNEAEQIFDELHKEVQSPDILFWYGKTLANNAKLEQGISMMEQAVSASKEQHISKYLVDLSLSYALIGRCSDANTAIHHVLQLNHPSYSTSAVMVQKHITSMCPSQP